MTTLHLLSAMMPTHSALGSALERVPAQVTCELILGKYIVIERDGQEYPLLFSRELQHSEMVPRFSVVISAGFYQFFPPHKIVVTGESCSLNMQSRPQDAGLILRKLLFIP